MSEYVIANKTDLVEIADATRDLHNSTDLLSLNNITQLLQSEKTAVDSAITELINKGVEVPEGATAMNLATLIAGIQAGDFKVEIGSYTIPSRFKGQLVLPHNLGVAPFLTLCVIHSSSEVTTTVDYHRMIGSFSWTGVGSLACALHKTSGTRFSHNGGSQVSVIANTATEFCLSYCYANYSDFYWYEGDTFDWLIIGKKD